MMLNRACMRHEMRHPGAAGINDNPSRGPQPQHRLPVSPELSETRMANRLEGAAMQRGGCPAQRPAAPRAIFGLCRSMANRKTPVALVGGADAPSEGATGGLTRNHAT